MALFNATHARRVEKLARAVEKTRGYNQAFITHNCGSPGCLMGWAGSVFPRATDSSWRKYLFGDEPTRYPSAHYVWARDAFSDVGCNDAGRSGKKAATFIRQMAKDLKAALKEAR